MKEYFEKSLKTYAEELREKNKRRLASFLDSGSKLSEDISVEVVKFLVAEVADSVDFFSFINTKGISLEEARMIIDKASEVRVSEVAIAVEEFKRTLTGDIKQEYTISLGKSSCMFYVDKLNLNNCPAPILQHNKIIERVTSWELNLTNVVRRDIIELRGKYLGEDVHVISMPVSYMPTDFSNRAASRLKEESRSIVSVSKMY